MALEGTGVRLDVRPVSSLLPHEETIPSRVERIADQIRRDSVQKDPVLIDGESGTVLDGMHRLAAFKRLGIENVICCTLDYSSRAVSLHRWARVYTPSRRGDFRGYRVEAGVTEETTAAHAFEQLESRSCGLAAFDSGKVFLPEPRCGLTEAFGIIRNLDNFAQKSGWRREFVPEDEMDASLQDPAAALVLVQRLTKGDVVHASQTKSLFPCKTSMHAVDPRPVAVNFPIEGLGTLTGAGLRRLVAASKGTLLPPNSIYEGRRYKERLVLLRSP